jgi:hypothetical protein
MPSTTALTPGGLPLPLALLATGGGQAGPGVAATATSAARKAAGATATKATAKAASTKAAASTAKKATTAKKTTSTASSAAKATGYATKLPADYAFLQDPRIPIEEKLSRFIGLLMAKSEQDLQRQMEKMAPGSTTASGGAGTTVTSKPKSSGFSLWGLAKQLLPPLNLASQLVGDTQLKALASKVSGPVLAAAATAVGLPQLAPLAEKFGPTLVGALSKDISAGLAALTGGGSAATTSGTTASSSGAKATGADPATSEKAQLMELQRLQDRDKELFTLFSNMLKAMHDARMTSIQNIR